MSKTKYINKEKLHQNFPHVAAVLDEIHEKNSQDNYWFFVNYLGKYKGKNGKPRTVSISAIIDVIEQHGYDVDLIVTPKKLFIKP